LAGLLFALTTPSPTFDPEAFDRLAAAEAGHFWFEERSRLIQWGLRRFFPGARDFCDVGCGTGFTLWGLESARPDLRLTGVDYYPEARPHAARRLHRTRLMTADICHLPFAEEFDVVGCFDVLEHIPDDQLALANLVGSIRPGGGLILTVPQHPSLWSVADEIGHHQRRYTRKLLRERIEESGLTCRRLTSFVSFLLPFMWANRRVARSVDDAAAELRPSPWSNAVGGALMRLERRLIVGGVSFPWGGSLLAIGVKPPR
jgi:SAM-dependent methyltransferase